MKVLSRWYDVDVIFLDKDLENIKFKGRQLAHWIHTRYPTTACVIAVEFKKFYMDEWTGVGDVEQIEAIRDALQSTIPGILEELKTLEC